MKDIRKKIKSVIRDNRIHADNILLEVTIDDYLSFAADILKKNEYQRKRVIASGISRHLKKDLIIGCTIPPIVLAVQKREIEDKIKKLDNTQIIEIAIENKALIILQRFPLWHLRP